MSLPIRSILTLFLVGLGILFWFSDLTTEFQNKSAPMSKSMALGLSKCSSASRMSLGKFQLVVSSLVAGELVMFGTTAHVRDVCQSVLLDRR